MDAHIVSQGLEDAEFEICCGVSHKGLDVEEAGLALCYFSWRGHQLNIGGICL